MSGTEHETLNRHRKLLVKTIQFGEEPFEELIAVSATDTGSGRPPEVMKRLSTHPQRVAEQSSRNGASHDDLSGQPSIAGKYIVLRRGLPNQPGVEGDFGYSIITNLSTKA